MCCVCTGNVVKTFIGENISSRFLSSLQSNSLIYFHNLKYDACFFINEPDWETQVTQLSGTLLQVTMDRYKTITTKNGAQRRIREKHLTFRNSYSIIPAPLSAFGSMFDLSVHKEIMPYKIYTAENIARKVIPYEEFRVQYREEQQDNKTKEELDHDYQQLLKNAKDAKAYELHPHTIDIMKYAKFYSIKDCVTLMRGMEKFNNDLAEVFKNTCRAFIGIHQFISVSAVGYDFARIYGCFDGCFQLSGKPQNFIQRCVSGGRTITTNN